jgi:signal transduction histidine kinase
VKALHAFALELLKPATLDDLLALLPRAFEVLLGGDVQATLETVLDDQQGGSPVFQRWCAYLPLAGGSNLRVVIRLRPESARVDLREHAEALAQAGELAAAAIASRRNADEIRERARAEAADLKFDLIGMLADEMRTPLASIKGYSSALLLDEIDLDNETQKSFFKRSRKRVTVSKR